MSFEVKLPLFSGPFDLLLFFIERDELDIYDIPIGKMTQDFLDYLHHLEQMNMEVAGEFILVASTLMRIKSRSMLPRPELNAKGEEIDPRQELVQQLLEYKKYKSVVGVLAEMEADRAQMYDRGNVTRELKLMSKVSDTDVELQDVDLYKLLKFYERAMQAYEIELNRPRHTVVTFPYTVEEQKDRLRQLLMQHERVSFEMVLGETNSKILAIFNFLAVLELLAMQEAMVVIGEGYNNFWLTRPSFQSVMELSGEA